MFTCAWIAFGLAWAEYNPRTSYISELAANGAPHTLPMVAAFLLLGALTLVFTLGLRRALGVGIPAVIASALVGLFSVATIGSGLARCDPGCGGASTSNQLHTLITYTGLGALVLATLVLPFAIAHDPRWRGFRPYSWLTGLLATAIFLRGFAAFGGEGLGQRLFVSLLFLWIVLVALRLQRLGPVQPRPLGISPAGH